MNKKVYIKLISDLKQAILASRYNAARLVNREILYLYFNVGKMISERISKENWGTKVIETISSDLQSHLPGMRGFSATNLKYMRLFYETYSFLEISQSVIDQLEKKSKKQISQSVTDQFKPLTIKGNSGGVKVENYKISAPDIDNFLSISFTHHTKLFGKVKSLEELFFYINECTRNQWSVRSVVEYAFQDIRKPIGVGTYKYKISETPPAALKKYIPKQEDLKKLLK